MMPTVIDRHSVEQYFEVEFSSDLRYEYIDGQTIEMDLESVDHNKIVMNLLRAAFTAFPQNYHRICLGRTRLKVSKPLSYLHPDLSIAAQPEIYESVETGTLCNPLVVFEVISPATEANDRGRKLELYQRIESLEYYVLISQEQFAVECFSRQPDGRWVGKQCAGQDSAILFESVNWTLSLKQLNQNVRFAL